MASPSGIAALQSYTVAAIVSALAVASCFLSRLNSDRSFHLFLLKRCWLVQQCKVPDPSSWYVTVLFLIDPLTLRLAENDSNGSFSRSAKSKFRDHHSPGSSQCTGWLLQMTPCVPGWNKDEDGIKPMKNIWVRTKCCHEDWSRRTMFGMYQVHGAPSFAEGLETIHHNKLLLTDLFLVSLLSGCEAVLDRSLHRGRLPLFSFPVAHKWFLRFRARTWAFSTPRSSWCSTQTPRNNAFSIRATFAGEGMTLIGRGNGDWHWLVPACLCGQEVICIMQTFAVCRGSVRGAAGRNIKGWTSQWERASRGWKRTLRCPRWCAFKLLFVHGSLGILVNLIT